MTLKEKLIAEIESSNESTIEYLWQILKSLSLPTDKDTIEAPTILERMGNPPQYFLNDGELSDRSSRKAAITQHIQSRQANRS